MDNNDRSNTFGVEVDVPLTHLAEDLQNKIMILHLEREASDMTNAQRHQLVWSMNHAFRQTSYNVAINGSGYGGHIRVARTFLGNCLKCFSAGPICQACRNPECAAPAMLLPSLKSHTHTTNKNQAYAYNFILSTRALINYTFSGKIYLIQHLPVYLAENLPYMYNLPHCHHFSLLIFVYFSIALII